MDGSDATLNTAKKAFDPVFTYSKDHGQHYDVSVVMAYGGHTRHRHTDVVSVTLARWRFPSRVSNRSVIRFGSTRHDASVSCHSFVILILSASLSFIIFWNKSFMFLTFFSAAVRPGNLSGPCLIHPMTLSRPSRKISVRSSSV